MNLLLALVLLSSTFTNGATLPRATGAIPCGGSGVSPELHWSNAPAGTRSFALIVHDPDAPAAGGFYHWVLYDIPPDTTTLPESAQIRANRSGRNGFGTIGYGGPCPPRHELHRYEFHVFALNAPLAVAAGATRDAVDTAMSQHVLAEGVLVGTFAH